jgi:hypothetical protein
VTLKDVEVRPADSTGLDAHHEVIGC